MKVTELSREQLTELKQRYLCDVIEPSYEELANVDEYVSDKTIFDAYDGIDFVEDDFWS